MEAGSDTRTRIADHRVTGGDVGTPELTDGSRNAALVDSEALAERQMLASAVTQQAQPSLFYLFSGDAQSHLSATFPGRQNWIEHTERDHTLSHR